ncbi:MAG: hypothetical protein JO347_05430 [Candidatus Eremiobacteraeota bacterium]|nr:hypothetical protein [Candidatus Eremiobacteraeota bacterium]
MIGDLLQWLLPAHHLSDARAVITTVQGLVTALLAIVIGLLIWTSYGVHSQQRAEATSLGTQLLQLDVLLDRIGPDGPRGRELMRQDLIAARNRFWGDGESSAPTTSYALARAELSRMDAFFGSLNPADEAGGTAIELARSLSASIVQTHLLMARQLHNPIPRVLIGSVVLWAALVFCCVGMGATPNALAVIVELLGAVSVASAIFLILEFSQPYVGHFRIPPNRIDEAIAALSSVPGTSSVTGHVSCGANESFPLNTLALPRTQEEF